MAQASARHLGILRQSAHILMISLRWTYVPDKNLHKHVAFTGSVKGVASRISAKHAQMNGLKYQELAQTCGFHWKCQGSCQQDFSKACPDEWLEVPRTCTNMWLPLEVSRELPAGFQQSMPR